MTEITPSPLNNVISIDDERIKNHLDRVVRGSVEETLKNSSRITSAPAHEDSLRRRIVQWPSAYFLAPNSRSRRQSSIKPSSCLECAPGAGQFEVSDLTG